MPDQSTVPYRTDAIPLAPTTLLTLEEVCAELRIGRSEVYVLLARKEMRRVKLGRRTLVARVDLEDYIARLIAAA